MASRIEQIIEEIEEYIDGCKYQALSSSKIIVNKDELEELLTPFQNTGRDQTLSEDHQQQRGYFSRCTGKGRCDHCKSPGENGRACK